MRKSGSSAIISAVLVTALATAAQAATFTDAVAWWQFEGTTNDANTSPSASNLVPVLNSETQLNPSNTASYTPSGQIAASNAGSQAFGFNGTTVLKSNHTSLRIAGTQTFWIRVKFDAIAPGTVALMSRHRAVDGNRGIALQVTNGRVDVLAASVPASDNSQVQAQAFSTSSEVLLADTWYDISLRFLPSTGTETGILRYDIYNPQTGALINSLETKVNVPSAIEATNRAGSGYFQIGANNNGSSGSAFVVPAGTQVEAAAVWNSYLTNDDVAKLSSVPEPASLGFLGVAALSLLRRHR